MFARLDNDSRGNDYGRAGDTRQHLAERFDDYRTQMLDTADYAIDATEPLPLVANNVCALPAQTQSDD